MDVDLWGVTVPDPIVRRAGMGSHQAASSVTDEWVTPREVIADLGPFDLDPCSPGVRRPWDTATVHYSEDGLARPWVGRVWLNPPYSDAAPWLARLADHGHGTALIFARTETAAWHDHVWPRATGIRFIRGRLTFHHVDGRRAAFNAGAPRGPRRRRGRRRRGRTIPGRYVPLGPRLHPPERADT